jgi:hypothetical protein
MQFSVLLEIVGPKVRTDGFHEGVKDGDATREGAVVGCLMSGKVANGRPWLDGEKLGTREDKFDGELDGCPETTIAVFLDGGKEGVKDLEGRADRDPEGSLDDEAGVKLCVEGFKVGLCEGDFCVGRDVTGRCVGIADGRF